MVRGAGRVELGWVGVREARRGCSGGICRGQSWHLLAYQRRLKTLRIDMRSTQHCTVHVSSLDRCRFVLCFAVLQRPLWFDSNTHTSCMLLLLQSPPPVYDVTNPSSLENLAGKWMRDFREYGRPDAVQMVVGNKIDLVGGVQFKSCPETGVEPG